MKLKYALITLSAIFCQCGTTPQEKASWNNRDSIHGKVNLMKVKADVFYGQNEYDSVVKWFTMLIAHDSNNGEYFFKRGYGYAELGKKQMAIDDFKMAIVLHFKIATCCYNIGLNYSYVSDSLALKYFKECIAADPGFTDAYIEIERCEKSLKIKRKG